MAALLTPDPAARTSTHSPGRTCARATSMCHAVRKTSANDAASSNERFSGLEMTLRAGTATSSAQVPSRDSPRMPYQRQR
jgi:hypothetical protein